MRLLLSVTSGSYGTERILPEKQWAVRSQRQQGYHLHPTSMPIQQDNFREWHELLGVMVHELTHMDISKHSAEFYTKMDELYTEIENDESSGLINRFDGTNECWYPLGPWSRIGREGYWCQAKVTRGNCSRQSGCCRKETPSPNYNGRWSGRKDHHPPEEAADLTTKAGRREASGMGCYEARVGQRSVFSRVAARDGG